MEALLGGFLIGAPIGLLAGILSMIENGWDPLGWFWYLLNPDRYDRRMWSKKVWVEAALPPLAQMGKIGVMLQASETKATNYYNKLGNLLCLDCPVEDWQVVQFAIEFDVDPEDALDDARRKGFMWP